MGIFDFIERNKRQKEADKITEHARKTAEKYYENAVAEGMGEPQALYKAAEQIDLGNKAPRDEKEKANWQLQMAEAYIWYEKAAKKDSEAAILRYAEMNEKGLGTAVDKVKAFSLYEKQAQLGSAEGQHRLGNCYYFGKGVASDYKTALLWYEKSAQQGVATAQEMCGYMYLKGQGTEVDYDKAFSWYSASEQNGHTVTNSWYQNEKEARKDKELFAGKDSDWWLDQALKYYNGEDVEKSYAKAFDCMEISARLGNATAMHNCAIMCEQGKGVTADMGRASRWYILAAEHGNIPSMRLMVEICSSQEDDEESKEMAMYWYEKLIKAGDEETMLKLFVKFTTGEVSGELYEKIADWFADAANSNNPMAQYLVAKRLLNLKRYDIALKYGLKAAEAGNVDAMHLCALIYNMGTETMGKNQRQAIYWAEKAAKKGNNAKNMLLCAMLCLDKQVDYCDEVEKGLYWLYKAEPELRKNPELLGLNYAWASITFRRFAKDESDYERALYWAELGASKGDADAMGECAILYFNGLGCQQSMSEAFDYAVLAAENGDKGETLYFIANRILDEQKLPSYITDAFQWFEKAMEFGNLNAFSSCGKMYEAGLGTEKNAAKAVEVYEKGAKAGNINCMAMLADMYRYGKGVERSDEKFIDCLEKAVDGGSALAMTTVVWGGMVDHVFNAKDAAKAKNMLEKVMALKDEQMCEIAEKQLRLLEKKFK